LVIRFLPSGAYTCHCTFLVPIVCSSLLSQTFFWSLPAVTERKKRAGIPSPYSVGGWLLWNATCLYSGWSAAEFCGVG
jgi:hypothetical protein